MTAIEHLRNERASLLRRIEPGRRGVVALRVRLVEVTHQLMRLESI